MRELNPKETKGLHKGHASDKTEGKDGLYMFWEET